MSTRRLMNLALGTVTILLLVSVGVVVTSEGDREAEKIQTDLATHQQGLIQNLNQDVADLSAADNLLAVNQARSKMGRTIIQIDQNLAALVKGGQVEKTGGLKITVAKVKNREARTALEEAARIWIETGLPLADLAAGEFSIFSAAGKEAVAGLTANSPSLANQMGIAAAAFQVAAQNKMNRAGYARNGVIGFGILFGALALARLRQKKPASVNKSSTISASAAVESSAMATSEDSVPPQEPVSAPVQAQAWDRHADGTFTSPVDFDNVNASVDQMSVDMNTIAGSTDKMRQAIDSVGFALQGMLYSLTEMAQDTAEGSKIVRGANNAASYTADTANELAASAQEMSRVVARVSQLAAKTKQVAGQIDAEAVSTGSIGEAFTSVVAAEVQGLAQKTSMATNEIEDTVAAILGTARQYEEAIGQIIKNISAINKVSQNLGELMLHPPVVGVAGTVVSTSPTLPLDPGVLDQASAPAPVTETPPTPEPVEPEVPEDTFEPDPSPEETADQTSAAIEEAVEDIVENAVEEAVEEAPTATDEAEPEAPVASAPKTEDDDGGTNIFMLNKPKQAEAPPPVEAETASEASDEPAAEVEEESVTVPPEADEPADDGGSNGNIFMLNKPKK